MDEVIRRLAGRAAGLIAFALLSAVTKGVIAPADRSVGNAWQSADDA
jgi:hypothetical protein